MAAFDIWKTVTGSAPNLMLERWSYDTITTVVTYLGPFNIGSTPLGSYHPPVGTLLYDECISGDQVLYYGIGNNTGVSITTNVGYPGCCSLYVTDFSVVRTNNTVLLTPNGTIVITAPVIDITLYEASIDGVNYVGAADGAITFEDLPAAEYTIIIREVSGTCYVTTSVTISDNIIYPPPIASETTLPSLYSPVFYPITIGYKLDNNEATVKEDMTGTYLEVSTQDGKDYLGSLPIINIFDNEDYAGTYEITGVDDVDDPQKFYLDLTYVSDQAVLFVPFDRELFQLFAEVEYNNYQKIADITVYPDPNTGEYLLRLEGFLQSVFEVEQPQNNGIEITLLRKYYVVPVNFDMDDAPTILNAVYSAIPDLTNYLGTLVPLGPAPINFISEQTQKGLPVLFSYIDMTTGRVINITSSDQTDIASSSDDVFISALPLSEYTLTWINPLGAIGSLNTDPALPDWITIGASPSDTVLLNITTSTDGSTGDYDGEDYDGDDYLTGGANAIVGCYTFEFFDDVTLLFTLTICIYPIQKANDICPDNAFNIAWVNREGGWSSYIFEGRKTYGKEIGTVTTYKKGTELKNSTIQDVYDVVEVNVYNKSIKDLVFIGSLRQSIQAYLFDNNTLQWSIPIVIDKSSFQVYTIPFKQIEVSDRFAFRIANEVIIQSQ